MRARGRNGKKGPRWPDLSAADKALVKRFVGDAINAVLKRAGEPPQPRKTEVRCLVHLSWAYVVPTRTKRRPSRRNLLRPPCRPPASFNVLVPRPLDLRLKVHQIAWPQRGPTADG